MLLFDTQLFEETTGDNQGGGGTKVETPPKVEVKKEEKEDEEDDDTKSERETAVQLYRALKDPKAGPEILKILAKEAGIVLSEGTKKEQKSAILEILEETLGSEYQFLAPKLGPAFERLFKQQRDEVEAKFSAREERDVQIETDNAIEKISKQFADFKDFTKQITKLTKDFTPSKGMSQLDYLTKLYKLAKAEAGPSANSKEDRLKRALGDINSKLSPIGGDDKANSKLASQRPTRKQAIEAAMNDMIASNED